MTTYPLCFSCARIVTGLTPLDTVHHDDPLTRTQIAAFLEAAGPLTITDTNNVPDTIEWTCAACGEISTGPARWATATSTELQGTDLSSLYPDVLLWLHTTRPDWAISVYDCGHSGRWPQINLPDGTVIRFSEDEDRTSTWTACRFCPDQDTLLTRKLDPYVHATYQEPIIEDGPTGDLSPQAVATLIQKIIDYGPYIPAWPQTVT
jgi:hypothetical protein